MTTRATTQASIPAADLNGRSRPSIEVPTLLLIAVTYAAWFGVTFAYRFASPWLVIPLAILVVSFHGSLQHEIVHGHPTRWYWLNRLFGMPPLNLWLPYERYRALHRIHHNDERLTDPLDDPESFYWCPKEWERLSGLSKAMLRFQQTLAGRVLIGCFWRVGAFIYMECRAFWRNDPGIRRVWLEHLAWCVPVILWVKFVCGIPLTLYVLAIVLPANGLQLIRSFAEHRARPEAPQRIAIVEDSWILGPLFLFNNLHSLHHESPLIPWYEYPARYRVVRERLIAENGGLVYRTYFDVARQYLFRSHDVLLHPTGRVPMKGAATQAGIA